MGKITINELHKSLFNYVQAVSDDKLETRDKTIVGAINELLQNSNNDTELNNLANEISNGKQLIANAIGEPLSKDDSFNEMSDDINSLLNQFKTNMMNNGIMVESGDKFKQLIDKIATMVEEGSNKGVQIASGVARSDSNYTITVSGLNFKPFAIYAYYEYQASVGGEYYMKEFPAIYVESLLEDERKYSVTYDADSRTLSPTDSITNDDGFELRVSVRNVDFNWIAYGIGEEDTTLRDSLADILEEEGVEVTEEDTMADLIVKVDSEFDRKNANSGLDIISATELPATGKENQICVITNSPVEKYIVSSVDSDFSNLPSDTILLQMRHEPTTNNYTLSANGITVKYYFSLCLQNKTTLASYVYKNGQWTDLTPARIYFIKDLVLVPGTDLGDIYNVSPPYVRFVANSGLYFYATNYNTCYCTVTSANKINMTAYNKVHIVAVINKSGSSVSDIQRIHLYASNNYYNKCNTSYAVTENFKTTAQNFNTTVKASKPANFYIQEFDFDITSWSGQYYFGITFTGSNSYDVSMYIQELYFY